MTSPDDSAFTLRGVPQLTVVDLADPRLDDATRRAGLTALEQVHQRHFPEYPHMVTEFEQWLAEGWPDPDIVIHLWLARDARGPCGVFVIHTNTRRGVVLAHYVAVDNRTRATLPRGWLTSLIEAMADIGSADCRRRGTELLAIMLEVPQEHVHKWTRVGGEQLDVGYGEPLGGRFRPDGEPEFRWLCPIIFTTAAGRASAPEAAAGAALRSFLLDYYQLNPDHETVAAMLGAVTL